MIIQQQYIGCFLALAIGDAYGAPLEGGFLERQLWKVLRKTKEGRFRYTDDTQMSIDIARSFLENKGIDQAKLANTFAASYSWTRGYGPSASKLLKRIRKGELWHAVNRWQYKHGSLGNGAAMRAPIVALCFAHSETALRENVIKTSEITHAHPLAIEGAHLVAYCTYLALHQHPANFILEKLASLQLSQSFQQKLDFCVSAFEEPSVSEKALIKKLGNGIVATESCITAIYFALKYLDTSIDRLITQVLKIGGDVDTIAAMACAIWGAWNGSST